jgi:hypothetical protein
MVGITTRALSDAIDCDVLRAYKGDTCGIRMRPGDIETSRWR